MEDNSLTIVETLMLVAWLFGPEVVIGSFLQAKYIKFLKRGRRINSFTIFFLGLGSSILTIVLGIIIWIYFPTLSFDVLDENGFNLVPFIPAIISALFSYCLVSLIFKKIWITSCCS